MTMQDGNKGNDEKNWYNRTITVDERTPQEVEKEDGWNSPLPLSLDEERKKRLTEVNPYVSKLDEYKGVVIPFDDAEGHRGQWHELFDAKRPMVLELGCGAGHFLAGEAIQRPDFNYLGLELRFKRLYQAAKKTAETLPNVRYVRYHAGHLKRIFTEKELAGVYIQYPDPWPKPKQATKRMVNLETIRTLQELLPTGGFIRLKSDWPQYLPWFRGCFEGSRFEETAFVPDVSEWNLSWDNIPTAFENKFVQQGKPCFFLEYTLR